MFTPDIAWLDVILRGSILGAIALCIVVVLVRIVGLRSLSKMTNFDFIMTVALGSLVAGGAQATQWSGYGQVIAGMVALFLVQFVAAVLRKSSDTVEAIMQNEPILLMRDGAFCEEAMQSSRVAKSDLIAKLREANVMKMSEVRAVVLETTGDVSVLHGDSLDSKLIENVRQK
ncbi:MAG: YetF domain-containing protein [Parerythrobacter sp.]